MGNAGGSSGQPSPTQGSAAATSFAFVGVNVVPMDQERVLDNHVVVVRDGRIAAMGPTGDISIPENAQTIEASGKYLIPGLADMHVHVRGARSVVEQTFLL